jgi:hypothetical protein
VSMRIKSKVGGAILSAMISATSLALNAFNFKPDIPWSWIAFISFLIFVGIIAWGWIDAESRAKQLERSRPSIVFSELSPASSILVPIKKLGYFTRLNFINNCAYPSGDSSTAHDLSASIQIVGKDGSVDTWDGRWANTDEPKAYGEIWSLNRLELPANNQRATLDIGFRYEGEKAFIGWDNAHFLNIGPPRVPVKPGQYDLLITIAASNMEQREFVFYLTVPDEPQSERCWPEVELAPPSDERWFLY